MGSVHYSVAILGGGPAGSICAALLRRGAPDQTILILEAERFPRHHVGEVSLPAWAPVLERAGILDALDQATAIKKAGVIFNWGPKDAPETWTADFREHHIGRPAVSSWHVDRATFDDQLLRHAAGLGATVLEEARVRTVTARPEGGFEIVWSTAEQEQRATADHVVDASGQARFLARHWSLGVQRHADMSNYAMYGYFTEDGIAQTDWPVAEDERWATIGTCDVGWVWHIPIRPGVVSVGVVTDRETMRSLGRDGRAEFYRQAIAGCPEIAPLLTDARWIGDTPDATEPESPPRVVSDWSYRVETLAGPGWFLAGDAAMFVDPILSSGMVLATRGASMAANALLTQWRHPQTDLELLRTSYQATYQDLAMAYHRMARVWYGRNLRAETWHWQARRERLRAGGLALYERDQDAFTALCLGAVADPLDAAVPEGSRDLRGTEFFSWLSARHLFQQDLSAHASWEEAPNADSARLATRRALMRQWQRLAHARVTPRGVTWQKGERYYTNLFRDEWSRIRFVEIELAETGPTIFPSFDDAPEGLLPHLDGSAPLCETLRDQLATHPVGSEGRNARIRAFVECALQLDLLNALDVARVPEPALLAGHPLVRRLLAAALDAIQGPARVLVEVDWLGDSCSLQVDAPDGRRRFVLMDRQRAAPEAWQRASATTGIRFFGHLDRDPLADALATRLLARLTRWERAKDPEVLKQWPRAIELCGRALAFDHEPGRAPQAEEA